MQYWTGTAWASVLNASVVGNNKVWRKFTFPALTTTKIRVVTSAGLASYSRLTEVEAYQATQVAANDSVKWLVSDHLGTPRMVADLSGSLSGIKRHDYLPFGEEIGAGVGGRMTHQGYSQPDGVRQGFTSKERDDETGLDFFESRYYASSQGRFTSVDPYNISLERQSITNKHKAESLFVAYLALPQQWNRYTYAINNPLKYIDPTGESIELTGDAESRRKQLEQARAYVGAQAGAYLYETHEKDGKYYIGIYTNGPDGKGPAFEHINAAAGELVDVIRHERVATLHLKKAGDTVSMSVKGTFSTNTTTYTIGHLTAFNENQQPGVTIVGDSSGRIDVYLLDPSTGSEGYIPASSMEGNQPGYIYPGEVFGHEMGHARAAMFREPDSNATSLRMENKGRKVKDAKAPDRKAH